MLKLIIKDLRANEGYLLLLFALLASISVGFNIAIKTESDIEAELYVLVVILSSMVASKLFILTELEVRADKLIAGLPVTRKQMVLAKYASSILMICLAMTVHWIAIQLSSNEAMRDENQFMYRPEMWIVSALILIASDAFSFPFYFAFGPVKGVLMYGVTLIAFMILTVLVINVLNPGVLLHKLVLEIVEQPAWVIVTELTTLLLLILGSSILISINVYKNKDL